MLTRYDSEVEDITFETPEEKAIRLSGGKVATPTKVPTSTPVAGLTADGEILIAYKAGQITYEQMVADPRIGQAKADQIVKATPTKAQLTIINGLIAERKAAGLTPGQSAGATATAVPGAPPVKVGSSGAASGYSQQYDWTPGGNTSPDAGPAGRTVAQIQGTDYLSDAERQWYLAKTKGAPSGTAAAGSGTAAAAAPKPPVPNSAKDLAARGAIPVQGAAVLEGQQYRRLNTVDQAEDGSWYIFDPTGKTVGGPFPNQTQANLANAYTQVGPAVTGNEYSALPGMAALGASRPRVPGGLSLDQIIAASATRGQQAGDFLGSAQPVFTGQKGPIDITRGGRPDYGGMTPVAGADQIAQSYTGQLPGNVSIGTGAGNEQSLQQTVGDKGYAALFANLGPGQQAQAQLSLDAMRQAGTLPDLYALSNEDRFYKGANNPSPYDLALADLKDKLKLDPYQHDYLPQPMAYGGQMQVGGGGGGYQQFLAYLQQLLARAGNQDQEPVAPSHPKPYSPNPNHLPVGLPYNPGGGIRLPNGDIVNPASPFWLGSSDENQNHNASQGAGVNDIWRGLMGNSPSWYTGPDPGSLLPPDNLRLRRNMAGGGGMGTGNEPMTVSGDWTGQQYAKLGEMNALTGRPGNETMTVTPNEPIVPMQGQQQGPMQPSAFAMLMEQIMGTRKRGRAPQYQMV